ARAAGETWRPTIPRSGSAPAPRRLPAKRRQTPPSRRPEVPAPSSFLLLPRLIVAAQANSSAGGGKGGQACAWRQEWTICCVGRGGPLPHEARIAATKVSLARLNERSRDIFRRIAESSLATGEPVGSRNISRLIATPLSPASVRNVM